MKKHTKRFMSMLLAVLLVVGSTPLGGLAGLDLHLPDWLKSPFSVNAEAASVSDLSYSISDGKVTITDCNSSASGALTIPATIEGYPVTSIGSFAFIGCSSLTSIEIPSGVTSIGESAFSWCSSLKSVSFGENSKLTSIGSFAFIGCSSLTSIEIPSGVTSIGDCAFDCCSSLTSIAIPSGVTSINDGAFSWCSSLKSVSFGENSKLTSIGEEAFYDCKMLSSITIPDSVTSISDYAFSDCESLTEIKIPDSVTSIGDEAFSDCVSLSSITIPDSVTSIGNWAFLSCSSLTSVSFGENSQLTSIGYCAFYDCSSLTGIAIPSGVTSIGDSAFYDCSSLTSIAIPSGVTSIGDSAFSDCESLTEIAIPSGVTSIGYRAFYGCSSLTSISVAADNANYSSDERGVLFNKSKTTLIQYPAGNTATSYTIPSGVTSIGFGAFFCGSNLKSITVTEDNANYSSDERGVLFNKSKTTLIQYPAGNTATSYSIPSGVTSIGNWAFYDCSSLTGIEIPSGVTSIGSYAFYGCSSLTGIEIPSGVTSIGESAFFGCISLTRLHIPPSVTRIGYNLLSSGSKCIICSTTQEAYAKTYANNYGYTFEVCTGHEVSVPVTGITVSPTSKALSAGETATLTATVTPTNATNKTVIWYSSNSAVATVSAAGVVTGVAAGTATITATANDKTNGTFTDTCDVTVIGIDRVEVLTPPDKTEYIKGETLNTAGLKLKAYYNDGSTKTVSTGYACSPTTLNTVGTQTITVTYGGKTCTFNVRVNNFATDLGYVTVEPIPDQAYDGTAKKPALIVTYKGKSLAVGTDYTAEYFNNINVGVAYVTITGKGSFSGKITERFNIVEQAVEPNFTAGDISSQKYTGYPIEPFFEAHAKSDNRELFEFDDYIAEYNNNIHAGTASVTLRGTGSPAVAGSTYGTVEKSFEITNESIANAVADAIPAHSFTGSAIRPEVFLRIGKRLLVNGVDYTLAYSNNTNVGTATITVTGIGSFTGTKTLTFEIEANSANFVADVVLGQVYSGSAITPTVTARSGSKLLTLNTDYTVSYSSNINVGYGIITITGKGSYTGTVTLVFAICGRNVSEITKPEIDDHVFDFTEFTPDFTLYYGGKALVYNVDYTYEIYNNYSAGVVIIVIIGLGNYTGKTSYEFYITQANASAFTVSDISNVTYTGSAISPDFTVSYKGETLRKNLDYAVRIENNINAGTVTIIIIGIGNFCGEKQMTFSITQADAYYFSLSGVSNVTYTGSAQTPTLSVYFGSTLLTLNVDYTVEFINNINVGNGTIIIRGIGNFKGEKRVDFAIDAANASRFTVDEIADIAFGSAPATPTVKVRFGGRLLVLNTDYTVEYRNNSSVGTATVIITGKGNFTGIKTAYFNIIVPAQSVTLSATTMSLDYKSSGILTATVSPADATSAKVVWTSSNTKVATVDQNGRITSTGSGTVKITATVEGTDISATCTVTVKYTFWQWIIRIILFGWLWY